MGLDANADGMRAFSGRALRARLGNVLYGRAALADLPRELDGVANGLTIVLPWAGLLAAVTRPEPAALGAIRRLCRAGATLDVVLALDPRRDRAELQRLGLPALSIPELRLRAAPACEAAGLGLCEVRVLGREELAAWPSTWARRLAHAHPRCVVHLAALAV
ncbi:MAG TPA: hypothetical protein VFM88_02975 [Vicinamibacteria bacterium]|nr:hypothetical protein [Vicinamibacteria bacterium]